MSAPEPLRAGPGLGTGPGVGAGVGVEPPAVVCTGLSVRYDRRRVLDSVDLAVAAGSWCSIVGPNGAGKTTLLHAVAGLVTSEGAVALAGTPAHSLRPRQRARRVALVPQVPIVPSGISVADYVLLGRTPHLSFFGAEGPGDHDAVGEALAALDLEAFARRPVESLSGGERQRVVIARALAQQAGLLFLDEPTTALDIAHQQQVLELLDGLRRSRGLTIVATLHDLTVAGLYTDQLVLLAEGRIVERGSPAEVLTEAIIARHYGAQVTVLPSASGPIVVPLRLIEGDAP